ncbi:MAG TPA: envelope integrity protein Cei [Pseudonocardiaceae bacterium]|nr:envelope integrity protein Cei [Pseudonocardiaceae bacterium]
MAAVGMSRERGRGYRRRKPIPAIVLAVLLVVAAIVVWVKVIDRADNTSAATSCPPVPAVGGKPAPQIGTPLAYTALAKVTPAPPAQVQVSVYNASIKHGAAQIVSTSLLQLGFNVAGDPQTDPAYPQSDSNANDVMACQGQIRFGANGESAARTLSLVLPCTELVRDNRQDASVSVSVGSKFGTVAPNGDAQQVLKQLTQFANTHPVQAGGQQAQGLAPQISPALLSGAASTPCA